MFHDESISNRCGRQSPPRSAQQTAGAAGLSAAITLSLEPEGKVLRFPRPKTAAQLLNKLGIQQGAALVIRDGELLTPDRRIEIDDAITVRGVISRG